MKMEIEAVINPQAAGAARATCAIVAPQNGAPARVAHMAMGEGREVRFLYSPEEALVLAQMLIVCACVAQGGPPPVVAPPSPPIIINGARS